MHFSCFFKISYFLSKTDKIRGYSDRPGPEVIKLFWCSTQLSMKFILLINVKMPTIVGILTFISMMKTTPERLKARTFFICRCLVFMSTWNFVVSWVEHEKSFITSGPGIFVCRWCILWYILIIFGRHIIKSGQDGVLHARMLVLASLSYLQFIHWMNLKAKFLQAP